MGAAVTVAVRVIPCLDVDAGRVVKGVRFAELRDAGDPVELARALRRRGRRRAGLPRHHRLLRRPRDHDDVVRRTAEQVFIPLTVGGGVRTVDDVDRLLRAGADKVGVNTAAIARPELLAEIATGSATSARAVRRRARSSGDTSTPSRVRGHDARRPAGHRHRRGRVGARAARSSASARSCSTRWTPTAPQAGFDLELIERGPRASSPCP